MPQSLARVYVHTVFSTKDRHPYFSSEEEWPEIHSYLGAIAKNLDCDPVQVGGIADHVHLLTVQSRTSTLAEFVKETKRVSSGWLKKRSDQYAKFAWQAGYGCFSVGEDSVDSVVPYIQGQNDHHTTISYQDEYRRLLREHGIEFDERYVWD
jgi:putative transposase